jgi:hypothetical protein
MKQRGIAIAFSEVTTNPMVCSNGFKTGNEVGEVIFGG